MKTKPTYEELKLRVKELEQTESELRQLTKELQESEEHFKYFAENSTDWIWEFDENEIFTYASKAIKNILGYTPEEVLGKSAFDIIPSPEREKVQEEFASLKEGRKSFAHLLNVNQHKNGSLVTLESSGVPIIDSEGGFHGYRGIDRNISERKQFEEALREGMEIYKAAINTPAMGFWAVDTQGRLVEVNDAYTRQSGYSREELLQVRIQDLEAKQMPDEIKANIAKFRDAGYGRFRTEHQRKDGTRWPLEVVTTFSQIQGGRFFAFLEDITDKIEQERRLELASRVFQTMSQAVVVTNANNNIISINPAVTKISGYSLEDVKGKNPRIFSSGRHDQAFYAHMWESIKTKGFWEGEIWDRRKSGEVYPKWTNIHVIKDSDGNIDRYFAVFSDITERKKTEEVIWKQANFDQLTGLANRNRYKIQLQEAIALSKRSKLPFALLLIDLDKFKPVNDTYGHPVGDILLQHVSKVLISNSRDVDTVARLGGDEFAVILISTDNKLNVDIPVRRIIDQLSEPVTIEKHTIQIGASIGVSIFPDDTNDAETLQKQADQALYNAKESGRNTYRTYSADTKAEK